MTQPKTAKGSVREVETSCTGWIDLLGYGSMLNEANYDPTHVSATQAIQRARLFHEIVSSSSSRYAPTAVLNDGAIMYRDMSPRARSVTYDFLQRALNLFHSVNEADTALGHPGARMIIAAGFRVRNTLDSKKTIESTKAQTIKSKLDAGTIDVDQAVNEALAFRPHSNPLPELQANFAMSKAYLAESGGTSAGFPGAKCYIDLSIFDEPPPEWITFSSKINWTHGALHSTFGTFESLDHEMASTQEHAGILDAFEIANRLSPDGGIESRLKSRKMPDSRSRK